jgi:hypothetical protein
MAAAVTLLVSTGRASRRPRYHPTTPAPTAPVFLLVGVKENAAGAERAGGSGGGCGAEDDGLEEMRWERKWDQGEGLGPWGLRRSGRRRRPPAWKAPAVAMAAAGCWVRGGPAVAGGFWRACGEREESEGWGPRVSVSLSSKLGMSPKKERL